MKIKPQFSLLRALREQHGQVLPWVAFMFGLFTGMGAFVLDVGHAYFSQRQLQAATDAAALAGGNKVYFTNAISTAIAYSGTTGVALAPNTYGNLQNVSMVPGYPKVECLNAVVNLGILCSGPNSANALIVKEQATIPTFFARVLGIQQVTLSATATSAPAKAVPLNVALIVDTTLSMNTYDSYIGTTQMQGAMQGAETLLSGLAPSIDAVSVFTFPNVSASTVANDTNCNPPQSQNPSFYSTPTPGLETSTPYTLPTIPALASTGYVVPNGNGTYQIVTFSQDYKDTNNQPNGNSNLVNTVGEPAANGNPAVQGCLSPPNEAGEFGTYLAGVIYAAQAALASEQAGEIASLPANAATPVNIMIILTDGNSNASTRYGYSNQFFVNTPSASGTYPSDVGDCSQAVVAATTAKGDGTLIFTIGYGSPATGSWTGSVDSSNCPTDQNGFFSQYHLGSNVSTYPNISPCQTLKDIASPDTALVQYFYSDPTAPGGDPNCTSASGATALNDAFAAITASLNRSRLIPNGLT